MEEILITNPIFETRAIEYILSNSQRGSPKTNELENSQHVSGAQKIKKSLMDI